MYIIRLLWSIFVVTETLSEDKRTSGTMLKLNPFQAVQILFRSALFRRLTCLVALRAFVANGVSTVLFFYLNVRSSLITKRFNINN